MVQTERLNIFHLAEVDAREFFELICDDGFNKFPINNYRQDSVESTRAWLKNRARGKYGVREKDSGDLIGMGGLTPWIWEGEELTDITYRLRESAWGKGYGWELAEALVHHGFEKLKLDQITATITPDNEASRKIIERLGFKFDRRILLQNVPTDLFRLYRIHYE